MSLTDLEKRIDAVVARRQAQAAIDHERVMREMSEFQREKELFDARSKVLFESVIEPLLRLLSERAQASGYQRCPGRVEGTVKCNLDRKVSAHIELTVGIRWHGGTQAWVVINPTLLPILLDFPRETTMPFDVASVTDEDVSSFVEDGIVDFLELVERVGLDPRYLKDAMEVDPVCGMSVQRAKAACSADWNGETHWFCVAACRDRFLAEPQRYVRSERVSDGHPPTSRAR